MPRMFADNLWGKWMVMNKVEMPQKFRFMIIATILGTTSIKTNFEKGSFLQFIRLAMIEGLT